MKKFFVSIAALALLATPLALATSTPAMAEGFKTCISTAMNGVEIPADRAQHFCIYGPIIQHEKDEPSPAKK